MRTVGLLAAAVALLAVVWLVRGSRPTSPAATAMPDAGRSAEPGSAAAALSSPGAATAPAESARAVAGASEAEADAPERQLVLRVVDAPHGIAIAGAHVRFADDPELYGELSDFWEAEHSDFDGFERLIAGRSRELVSDAAGEVRLGCRREHAFALASAPQRWGWAAIDPKLATPQEIVLRPDAELCVKVVDSAGAPVSGLTVFVDNGADDFDSGRSHTMSAVTAADGTARMSHVRWWMESDPGRAVVLSVEALLAAPVHVALERERFPHEPIVIVLPFTGSVEVVQKDERDEERRLGYTIELVDVPDPGMPDFDLSRRNRDQGLAVSSNEPRVRFAFVEIGLLVEASTRFLGPAGGALRTRGAGPRAAGERVELVLGGSGGLPVLVGRALDPQGEPLRSRHLSIGFLVERGGATLEFGGSLETDGEGRFRVPLDPAQGPAKRRTLSLSFAPPDGAPSIEADVPIEDDSSPGAHELGDVRLLELPAVVSGTVVGEGGDPVPGAVVRLLEPEPPDSSQPTQWRFRDRAARTTDRQGAFELRSRGTSPEVGVEVGAQGFFPLPMMRVARGVRDLRIVLERSGGLVGEVLLEPPLRAADVVVAYRPTPPAGPSPEWLGTGSSSAEPRADGGFELRPLGQGVGTVEVWLVGRTLLRTIEGVRIVAGETTHLEPIDLRGKGSYFALDVREPGGALPDEGRVRMRPSSGGTEWTEVGLRAGRAVFSARGGPLDLVVDVEGFRLAELAAVAADRELVLRPAIPVALALGAGAHVPAPPYWVGLVLEPATADDTSGAARFASHVSAIFDAQGRARAVLGAPGRWRVDWNLEQSTTNARVRTRLPSDKPQWIEVADREGVQQFVLMPPPEVLARLDALGRR